MIFYKGCPLRCAWCSNPESQYSGLSILFDKRLCRNFGDCIDAGSGGIRLTDEGIAIDRAQIFNVDSLRGVCASGALKVVGEKKCADDILKEVLRDLPFYSRSKGGVTLSGGEPLSAGEELTELLAGLKDLNIDVAVETSLHVPWESIERTIGFVDTYLVDIKHTDGDILREFTGGSINLINENLEKLIAEKQHIVIRIPVIPGFNHTTEEMKAIINYVVSLKHLREIHFIPFHNLGAGKYEMAGMEYAYSQYKNIQPSELTDYIQYAEEQGFKTKTGG